MIHRDYCFIASIFDADGGLLMREPLPDPAACYDDLHYSSVLNGSLPNDGAMPRALVEPLWKDEAGGELTAIRLSLESIAAKTYPRSVFWDSVWQLMRSRGALKEVKTFIWRITVVPRREAERPRLRVSLRREPYPFTERPLRELGFEESLLLNTSSRLLIANSLLDELRRDSAQCLDSERADILAGYLVKDRQGDARLIVSGRVPARSEGGSSVAHFTFTPMTFVLAQKEIEERGRGETILGWAHNHPPPCGRRCLQLIPPCKATTAFFSMDDHIVHRESFASPYMVAFVAGKESEKGASDPVLGAFSWEDGMVREREFYAF